MNLLFSYGSLRDEAVQRATFGRRLRGEPDALPGFESARVSIEDPGVVEATGETHYANVVFNGRDDSRVDGVAFEVTDAELEAADRYEAEAGYVRVAARLASGRDAWVYAHHGSTS
jgi:gamma-glutamylcyclotransferase (GGCT)/AIG2-like uncharacterized protein YtfP